MVAHGNKYHSREPIQLVRFSEILPNTSIDGLSQLCNLPLLLTLFLTSTNRVMTPTAGSLLSNSSSQPGH
jgi:hypothetical protein